MASLGPPGDNIVSLNHRSLDTERRKLLWPHLRSQIIIFSSQDWISALFTRRNHNLIRLTKEIKCINTVAPALHHNVSTPPPPPPQWLIKTPSLIRWDKMCVSPLRNSATSILGSYLILLECQGTTTYINGKETWYCLVALKHITWNLHLCRCWLWLLLLIVNVAQNKCNSKLPWWRMRARSEVDNRRTPSLRAAHSTILFFCTR